MSNPYKMNRADLETFVQNLLNQLTLNTLVPISILEQDARVFTVTPLLDDLQAAIAALVTAETAYHAAVATAQTAADLALDEVQSVKFLMKSAGCSGATFALAGFDPPSTGPVPYMPNDPTELSAFGYSNNTNSLKWKGNNSFGAITYVVECLIGASVNWVTVGIAGKQRFQHVGVVPGTRYEYRVFARAASSDSGVSGSAVVY